MTIALNIFTNSTRFSPSTEIIRKTYKSFCDTFGIIKPTVYCDPNPNRMKYNAYERELKKIFPVVIRTSSLSDGYMRSIRNSTTDYIFQLEGDWMFQTDLIKHSLEQITECMHECGIYHFRFNKRDTEKCGWEKDCNLDQYTYVGNDFELQFCQTNILSNNPHIIDRKKYVRDVMKYIKVVPGSKGIEECLSHKNLSGAIYGPILYPRIVLHLDGRGKK